PDTAKTDDCHELSTTRRKVYLRSERYVSVFSTRVLPLHFVMFGNVLPAVRNAHETRRHFLPRGRATEGKRDPISLRVEHRKALVIADPPVIAGSAIAEVRRENCVKAIIRERAYERNKTDFLDDYVPEGVGEYFFLNPIAPLQARVGQFVYRNAVLVRAIFKLAIAFLFGEESLSIRDEKPLVSRARLVHSRVIDFVQNAMAQCEPDSAVQV